MIIIDYTRINLSSIALASSFYLYSILSKISFRSSLIELVLFIKKNIRIIN